MYFSDVKVGKERVNVHLGITRTFISHEQICRLKVRRHLLSDMFAKRVYY